MFLVRRPSSRDLDRFLEESRLPLSYDPVGIATRNPAGFTLDEHTVLVGHGDGAFARASAALVAWKHFELGWVELFPKNAPIDPGTVVAVSVSHLGFWSLNGCRIVYSCNAKAHEFGFAYGTLANHAEAGEEIFKVSMNTETGSVAYSIRAASRPRAALARLGYPITRALQARFRHDSGRAMARAIGG
jgi:uncharacterized protein (UPF0548 family)